MSALSNPTEADDMQLPTGKTCADCAHIARTECVRCEGRGNEMSPGLKTCRDCNGTGDGPSKEARDVGAAFVYEKSPIRYGFLRETLGFETAMLVGEAMARELDTFAAARVKEADALPMRVMANAVEAGDAMGKHVEKLEAELQRWREVMPGHDAGGVRECLDARAQGMASYQRQLLDADRGRLYAESEANRAKRALAKLEADLAASRSRVEVLEGALRGLVAVSETVVFRSDRFETAMDRARAALEGSR